MGSYKWMSLGQINMLYGSFKRSLVMLQWTIENGCPWDETTWNTTQSAVLQWASEMGFCYYQRVSIVDR
jgi:hypothetical protein